MLSALRKGARRPIRAIREPFGTAGLIIACIALVAALGGTALAAKGALTGKQKKEVETIAKKFAGKPGPAGANGSNGSKGKDGANGKKGAGGALGPAGESVTIAAANEVECPSGGAKFTNKTGTGTACNGTTGFTETLPEEKTETGGWVINSFANNPAVTYTAISFTIPLEFGLDEQHVVFLKPGDVGHAHTSECPGTVASPSAEPGYLCVYASRMTNLTPAPSFDEHAILKLSDPELASTPGADPA